MFIDFKITTWERVHVSDDMKDNVLELLKNKTIESSNDMYNELDAEQLSLEKLDEVEEEMTVEENGGCSTVEAFTDEGETIYQNGE